MVRPACSTHPCVGIRRAKAMLRLYPAHPLIINIAKFDYFSPIFVSLLASHQDYEYNLGLEVTSRNGHLKKRYHAQ